MTSADVAAKSPKYWKADQEINLRRYFEEFARQRNRDPLLPETWYSFAGKFYQMQKVHNLI